jgi:hypothetical protein
VALRALRVAIPLWVLVLAAAPRPAMALVLALRGRQHLPPREASQWW